MSKERPLEYLHCQRCNAQWLPYRLPVRYCGSCKSSLWNKPRKYYSPESQDAPTEKRTGLTGRAAAKQRAENKPSQQNTAVKRCNDCGTSRNVFFSPLQSNLCESCEAKRQLVLI